METHLIHLLCSVEIEQILIGNQQTFFFGKWTAWTTVSPLFLIPDMMMSFGDHGRAPRNFLRGIAFDAMTISYSVVFDGKDAFLSCVTSPSGNTIFGGLNKMSCIILYISNVEKIIRFMYILILFFATLIPITYHCLVWTTCILLSKSKSI